MTLESFGLAWIMALVFLVRLLPAWLWPAFTSDAGFHLLMRREIRYNGFRVPRKLEPCLFDKHVSYPWLFHQLIAFLPETWLQRVPALPSAIIDGVHAMLAGWGAYWLANVLGHPEAAVRAGLLGALFFGINPALLAHGMGPRAYEVTPRPMGELLFSMAMLVAIWTAASMSWGGWIVAAITGGLLLLSSKFAAQVLMFFTTLLAFVPGFHAAWGVLPGAFLAAMLLSGGRYRDVLRGQWIHLQYYRRKLQYTFSIVAGRNRWQEVRAVLQAIRSAGLFSKSTLRALARLYADNTYLLLLVRGSLYLVLLAIGWSAVQHGSPWMTREPALWLLAWAWVWLPPFLLTSTRHLRFLGEAERYAEYGICPAAVLVGVGLAVGPTGGGVWFFLAVHALCTTGVVAHAWFNYARVASRDTRSREELVSALTRLPPDSVLLGVPAMQVLAPVAYRLPCRFTDISADTARFVEMIEKRYDGYPWPKPDWEMWRALGVEYMVTFSPEFLRQHRPSLSYEPEPLKLVFSNAAYRVYDIRRPLTDVPPPARSP